MMTAAPGWEPKKALGGEPAGGERLWGKMCLLLFSSQQGREVGCSTENSHNLMSSCLPSVAKRVVGRDVKTRRERIGQGAVCFAHYLPLP